MTLNIPCANANCIAGFKFNIVDRYAINETNGLKNSIITIVPTTLKIVCEAAVRLATMLVPIAAKIAVIVVPILLPNNNGRAASKVIAPCVYIS